MMRSLVFAAAALSASAFAPVARPSSAVAPAASPSLSTLVAAPRAAVVLMAVPKSRTSKKKTRQRKANWFAKANIQRERALTLGRSVLSEGEGSFIYNPDEEDDELPVAVAPVAGTLPWTTPGVTKFASPPDPFGFGRPGPPGLKKHRSFG